MPKWIVSVICWQAHNMLFGFLSNNFHYFAAKVMMLLTSLSLYRCVSLVSRARGTDSTGFNVMRVLSRCKCRVVVVVADRPKICTNRTTQGTIYIQLFSIVFYGDFFFSATNERCTNTNLNGIHKNCHWIFMRWFITMQFSIRHSH